MSDPSQLPPEAQGPAAPGDAFDVLDYLNVDSRHYALQEIGRVRALGYFLPLLHELFAGSEAKTKIVYAILHSLMTDKRVHWTRAELDEKLHWLKDGHRNYLLYRLSNVGWLEYLRDQGMYMISDKGEALMRVLSRFSLGPELVENEGAALAEIEFSILLDLDDLPDRLQFLRNRLLKHSIRAENALESESAYRILEIYQQLKSAYRWAEQTRQTLDHIEIEEDDSPQWSGIRAVHSHLSLLHQLISKMQVVLQDIQNRQIDIARYGLTHLDFDNYLIHANADSLAEMMTRHLTKIPHPFFSIQANIFHEAAEILGREISADAQARGWDLEVHEATAGGEREVATETESFTRALISSPKRWTPLKELLVQESWEVAAYRVSLLTMLADFAPQARESAGLDPLINVPIEAEFDTSGNLVPIVAGEETWSMTDGRFRRVDREAAPQPPAAATP